MCGRLVIDIALEMITEIYGIVRKIDRELNPRYSCATDKGNKVKKFNESTT